MYNLINRLKLRINIRLFLLAVLFLFSFGLAFLFENSIMAASDVKLSIITSASTDVHPGDTIAARVRIDTNGKKVGKLVLNISVPDSLLSVASLAKGSFFPKASNKIIERDNVKITLEENCTGDACNGLQGTGQAANLQIKVDENAATGAAMIKITNQTKLFGKNKQNDLEIVRENLTLNIINSATPTATPTDMPDATPSATLMPTPTPNPHNLKADLDGNKKVDIFDFNVFVKQIGKDGKNKADFDGNKKVNQKDFNKMVEYLVAAYR